MGTFNNLPAREEIVRTEYSQEEAIRMIEQVYHAKYDPESGLDAWDQLLACEAVSESATVGIKYSQTDKTNETNESVGVNGSVSDTYKRRVNFKLTPDKLQAVTELKLCTYRTDPSKVAQLLNGFFKECESKPEWWLAVAQRWPPRVISWNLLYMVKRMESGWLSLLNPAAYFTNTLKYRKKRKQFRRTSDTRKTQGGKDVY